LIGGVWFKKKIGLLGNPILFHGLQGGGEFEKYFPRKNIKEVGMEGRLVETDKDSGFCFLLFGFS
jgi:hypothetical protein